jgi:phosphonate transport system permease protein
MTRPEYSPALKVSLGFVGIAIFCLIFADLTISTLDPWTEMQRMALGLISPDFFAVANIGSVIIKTIAFALCGVALGAFSGFFLAQVFHIGPIRWACAFVRAIHELFWALILLQILGLTPLTGVLAIAIPYAGICAKVYAETLEESQPAVLQVLPVGSSIVSSFFYARLPDVWVHIKNYTGYRFECGLRSSAVLGFVGLPTLGFYLETAFSEGNYSEAAALMILFYILIASLRYWLRPRLLPFYLLAAPFLLGSGASIDFSNILRFFGRDIVPAPLRNADLGNADIWGQFADWLHLLLIDQALPGIIATVLLTQIALVATGVLTLALFPLFQKNFSAASGVASAMAFWWSCVRHPNSFWPIYFCNSGDHRCCPQLSPCRCIMVPSSRICLGVIVMN